MAASQSKNHHNDSSKGKGNRRHHGSSQSSSQGNNSGNWSQGNGGNQGNNTHRGNNSHNGNNSHHGSNNRPWNNNQNGGNQNGGNQNGGTQNGGNQNGGNQNGNNNQHGGNNHNGNNQNGGQSNSKRKKCSSHNGGSSQGNNQGPNSAFNGNNPNNQHNPFNVTGGQQKNGKEKFAKSDNSQANTQPDDQGGEPDSDIVMSGTPEYDIHVSDPRPNPSGVAITALTRTLNLDDDASGVDEGHATASLSQPEGRGPRPGQLLAGGTASPSISLQRPDEHRSLESDAEDVAVLPAVGGDSSGEPPLSQHDSKDEPSQRNDDGTGTIDFVSAWLSNARDGERDPVAAIRERALNLAHIIDESGIQNLRNLHDDGRGAVRSNGGHVLELLESVLRRNHRMLDVQEAMVSNDHLMLDLVNSVRSQDAVSQDAGSATDSSEQRSTLTLSTRSHSEELQGNSDGTRDADPMDIDDESVDAGDPMDIDEKSVGERDSADIDEKPQDMAPVRKQDSVDLEGRHDLADSHGLQPTDTTDELHRPPRRAHAQTVHDSEDSASHCGQSGTSEPSTISIKV